jgi:NADH-quinone oxidoreductase subunit I
MTATKGVIALIPEACTSCMICVQECPTWCITLDSHQEQVSEPGARRPRTVAVLDRFTIDFGLCMYCGICVEACPFDALEWRPDVDYSSPTRAGLIQDTEQLASWCADD